MTDSSTRKHEALDRLSSGILQLTSSEAWTAYLRMQARFHPDSFSNTLLM